jgi:NIMA (never in mitosis gene a)-related kinase
MHVQHRHSHADEQRGAQRPSDNHADDELLLPLQGEAFPEEQLMLWCAELLLALQYLHRKKVLHRDIKTSNIFLTSTGQVQLGDFGLATYRGTGQGEAQAQDQSVVGTPHFMSPEIVSMQSYSFQSDIW